MNYFVNNAERVEKSYFACEYKLVLLQDGDPIMDEVQAIVVALLGKKRPPLAKKYKHTMA